jgi:hypothetical protein
MLRPPEPHASPEFPGSRTVSAKVNKMNVKIDPVELGRLVDEGVLEALEADGYTKIEDGEKVEDRIALAKAVLGHVILARAESKDERQAKAVSKGQLAKLVYPSTPEPDPNDEVAVLIRKRLVGLVGSLIQTGRRGTVQKMVAARGEGLVMCATSVGDDEVAAVYVTSDADLIDADWATPRTTKIKNLAEETAKEFSFVIEQKPEMAKRLNTKMDKGLKQARIAATAVLAITAGNESTTNGEAAA